jgi:hypothetical protein
MSVIIKVVNDLIPAPVAYARLGNGKNANLQRKAVIHKTGRSCLTDTDTRLRAAHRKGETIIATHEPWTTEVAEAFAHIGTRAFFHETDSHEDKGGVDVAVKDGGIYKAVVTIAQPVFGIYPNNTGTAMEEAVFVECITVAESPEPVRFGDIFKWENGKFSGEFHPHIKGCTSDCPIEVWNYFVTLFGK